MTIDEIFNRLHKLQDVLAEKIALEKKIQSIPKVLEDRESLLVRLKKTYIEQYQDYEDLRTQQAGCRNQLLEAESKREKAEKNMEATTTQREYEIIDKEIRDASEKEHQCRKELQHVERRLAEIDEKVKANKTLIDEQEGELAEQKRNIEAERVEEEKKIAALTADANKLSEGLDEELLFKFERIIRKKGSRGIVAVRGGVCESCHMILPVQFANNVRRKEKIVSCPYCSSFLFYEDVSDGETSFLDEEIGSLASLDDDEEQDEEELDEEDTVNIDDEE
ncbi:MAG: C4-type zinc ribbon domain-containing protein [Spirochaetaceae bacterium]|jgi:predicted  nucleic acid-binding Zn-ribbon protein|nr:C4-type zinc ribbon domain-containing protein [Spirochaetaceae bacterium]